jgi:hypothetical protein
MRAHRSVYSSCFAAALLSIVATPASAQFTPLHYRGGTILPSPQIAPLYIGVGWTDADIATTQSYLQGLAGYLQGTAAPTGCQSVVQQYGVTGGSVLLPDFIHLSSTKFTRGQVANIISTSQQLFGTWGYAYNRIVLALFKGSPVDFGTENGRIVDGFHDDAGGGQYYAAVAWELTGDWSSFETLISHEIFEAATDPSPANGVFQDQAWVYDIPVHGVKTICFPGVPCFDLQTSEGGDECEDRKFDLSFGTIQAFADNSSNACSFWGHAPGAATNCAPLRFTPAPFFRVDTRFFTDDGDWSFGDFKAECAASDRVAGISATAIGISPELRAHVALCETSYFTINRGVFETFHNLTGPTDDRGDTATGDWDYGYYKAECGPNEVVVGVSQNAGSLHMSKIACGSTTVSEVGNDDSRCVTLPFSHVSDVRLDTASGDWSVGYSKNECRPQQLLKGVSSNPATGEIHAILCCDTKSVVR